MKSIFLLLSGVAITFVNGNVPQQVLHVKDIPVTKSVAIIGTLLLLLLFICTCTNDTLGGGASGTSTAFWLRNVFPDISITIFEKNTYIGGRSTTVPIKDDISLGTIELGASIFVEANKNLMKATEKFGLQKTRLTALADQVTTASRPGLGVWNGNQFLFEETGSYWDSVKAIWRYGLTPLKVKTSPCIV
jgi:prenylcysteine oxidase/farnesylcysteine lyase